MCMQCEQAKQQQQQRRAQRRNVEKISYTELMWKWIFFFLTVFLFMAANLNEPGKKAF